MRKKDINMKKPQKLKKDRETFKEGCRDLK